MLSIEGFAADAGFKIFLGIREDWGLTPAQCLVLLGFEPSKRSTWNLWLSRLKLAKEIGSFDRDRLERLSHLAQIYRGVTSAFPDDRHGLNWLAAPNANPVFRGSGRCRLRPCQGGPLAR